MDSAEGMAKTLEVITTQQPISYVIVIPGPGRQPTPNWSANNLAGNAK